MNEPVTEIKIKIKPFMKLKQIVFDTLPANEKKVLINTLLGEAGNVSIDKKTFQRDEKWVSVLCRVLDESTKISKDIAAKLKTQEEQIHKRGVIWKRGVSSPRDVSDKSIPDSSQDAI